MTPQTGIQATSMYCPLRIESVNSSDPVLTLGGLDWNFSTMNPWRLGGKSGVEFSSISVDADSKVSVLLDKEILSFDEVRNDGIVDLQICLSDGLWLQIFSMGDVEDWIVNLPRGFTLVFP